MNSLTDLKNAKQSLTTYSVKELNESIGLLLSRGFAPKFILEATVSKSQIKKGHLWLTLTDGKASVDGVAWSSTINSLKFLPGKKVSNIGPVEILDINKTDNILAKQILSVKNILGRHRREDPGGEAGEPPVLDYQDDSAVRDPASQTRHHGTGPQRRGQVVDRAAAVAFL